MTTLNLRSPVVSVIGAVNTGKTTFIKRVTNKKFDEIGEMTQTLTPFQLSKKRLIELTAVKEDKINIPSLFIIDTPGHAPFSLMRETAMKITDFAIVLVDIFDGITELTSKAISYLVQNKKPFVIAVNKVDRIHNWKPTGQNRIKNALSEQNKDVQLEYEIALSKIIQQLLSEFGIQSELYYRNTELRKCISIIPISTQSGEGIADLIMFCDYCAEKILDVSKRNTFELFLLNTSKKNGFYLECLLLNGTLSTGDIIYNGNISLKVLDIFSNTYRKCLKVCETSDIISVFVPDPGCNLVTNTYLTSIKGLLEVDNNNKSDGLTIWSNSIDHAYAVKEVMNEKSKDMRQLNIPISNIVIGNIKKADIIKCSTMKNELLRTVLYFSSNDKEIADPLILKFAKDNNVTVLRSSHIYQLRDLFVKHLQSYENSIDIGCKVQLLSQFIFSKTNPIVIGVKILEGQLKLNDNLSIDDKLVGNIISVQQDKKDITYASSGQSVAIKINSKLVIGTDIKDNAILSNTITPQNRSKLDSVHAILSIP